MTRTTLHAPRLLLAGLIALAAAAGPAGAQGADLKVVKEDDTAAQYPDGWTYEALDAFIKAPKTVMAGTKMAYGGVKNDKTRADLLAYLQSLSDAPKRGERVKIFNQMTETHRVLYHAEQLSNCASGIHVDGHVLFPDMGGILWCIDTKSGAVKWKERIVRGGSWGSIVRAADRLYMLGQSGATVVFAPRADKLEILATNDLGEQTNSTPAVSNGELFLRTHEHLYCIAAQKE